MFLTGFMAVSRKQYSSARIGKASQNFFFPVGRNTFHMEWTLFSLPLVLNPLYIQYMILHLFSLSCKAYLQVYVSGGKGTLSDYNFSSHKRSFSWLQT